MNYVGLDIHKNFCHATVLAEDGAIVKSGRFETNRNENGIVIKKAYLSAVRLFVGGRY